MSLTEVASLTGRFLDLMAMACPFSAFDAAFYFSIIDSISASRRTRRARRFTLHSDWPL